LSEAVKFGTTTAITSSAKVTGVGQTVTFTARVTPSLVSASQLNLQTVTFMDGANVLAVRQLKISGSSAVATFATSALAFGGHSITAVFGETANFVGSSSNALSQDVRNAAKIALSSVANPAFASTPLTYTALVSGNGGTPPTGTVTFYLNGTAVRTATVINGKATFVLPRGFATIGNYVIRALYSGDSSYTSVLAALAQRVVNRRT
jgi:hypothetical protein